MSVRNRKVLRPGISTQVFLVFLSLQAHAEMVPSCYCVLLMHPSRLQFIKIQPLRCKVQNIQNIKIPRPCLREPTNSFSELSSGPGCLGMSLETLTSRVHVSHVTAAPFTLHKRRRRFL
jgi:hypothetical protein